MVSRACVPCDAVVPLILPSLHDDIRHNETKLLKLHALVMKAIRDAMSCATGGDHEGVSHSEDRKLTP